MNKYVATYKTAMQAGLEQREVTTTFVDDLNDKQRESLIVNAGAVVRVQTRIRQGKLKFEDVDGKELMLSRLLERSEMTEGTAKAVLKAHLSEMEPVEQVLYLFNNEYIDDDMAEFKIAQLHEKGIISDDEAERAMQELGA